MTTSIPMVGPTADPVALGLTSSLARPDRNFTGVVIDAGLEIWGKRVQLLLEVTRKVTKLGFLNANPSSPTPLQGYGAYISDAARRGGITTAYVLVAGKIDRAAFERIWATVIVGGETIDQTACEKSFDAMEKNGVDGLIVSDSGDLLAIRQLIVDLVTRFRVPAIYPNREFVEVGGLMAYGVDTADFMRRVATMTGQVLGGARPSDIPFYRQTIRTCAQSKSSKIAWAGIPSGIVDDCRRCDRIRLALPLLALFRHGWAGLQCPVLGAQRK